MNFRGIKYLNVKSEITKLVEDDMEDYLYSTRMEKAFLHTIYMKEREEEKNKSPK